MHYVKAFLALLACCTAQALDFENMTFFPVNHPECRGFVVIEEMVTSYRLYYVSKTNMLEVMLIPPKELNICSIEAVEQSPDGDKVVILSVGEGHPTLAIYRIADLIAHAEATKEHAESTGEQFPEEYTLSCIAYLDPYPGLCGSPKWGGNDTVEFLASEVDFREFDPATRRAKWLDTATYTVDTWRWKFADDAFTLLKSEDRSASPKRTGSRIEQIKKRIRPDLHEKRK